MKNLIPYSMETKFSQEYLERLLKKPENIFKTKQIYYALSDCGALDAKLSPPRPLNINGIEVPSNSLASSQRIQWPANMQVIPEKIVHKNYPPNTKEMLYKPTGLESQPMAFGLSSGATLVYSYEPIIGKYLESSKPYGTVVHSAPVGNATPDSLHFESRFESGNLQKAIRTGPNDYELYLRPDLYTTKYTQWFYFRVSNTKKRQLYRFTVVNFYKANSLFSQGMRPLMYSEKAAELSKIGWTRVGNNIQYYRTKWAKENPTKSDHVALDTGEQSSQNGDSQPKTSTTVPAQSWYSLTWTFECPHDDDVVYFASCYPYTYNQLRDYLNAVKLDPYRSAVCEQTMLCNTLAGNPVPLLTITEPDATKSKLNGSNAAIQKRQEIVDDNVAERKSGVNKQCVVISARVHPGETQSSWMIQGLLDFLLSQHPDAEVLRANFVFKIVPMLNPDGVIVGNYRCSLSGCDLNRKYKSDLKRFFPTVWHTKRMVLEMMCHYPVLVYCDLHGHSRKQQMFIYGCRSADPTTRLLDRVFPLMLSRNAPELFDYDKCRFSVQREKEGTGRIVMWREGISNSYTLEATFCGSGKDTLTGGYHFTCADYEQMGQQFCETMLDFCDPDKTKTELMLAELESIRRLGRNKRGASSVGSLSDYSSEEDSSDTGSDSSNCDELPAYYNELLKTKQQQPKRRTLLQRQQDASLASMSQVQPTPGDKFIQCAPIVHRFTPTLRKFVCPICETYACQRGKNLAECTSTAGLQIHKRQTQKKIKKTNPHASTHELEIRDVNEAVVNEARWIGQRRSSASCLRTNQLDKDFTKMKTTTTTDAVHTVDANSQSKPDLSDHVTCSPERLLHKRVSWIRASSAPADRASQHQVWPVIVHRDTAPCLALDRSEPTVTLTSSNSDHSTITGTEAWCQSQATGSVAQPRVSKFEPNRADRTPTRSLKSHEHQIRVLRATLNVDPRMRSSENLWPGSLDRKRSSTIRIKERFRSSRDRGIRRGEPHSPDLTTLVLTGTSIVGPLSERSRTRIPKARHV